MRVSTQVDGKPGVTSRSAIQDVVLYLNNLFTAAADGSRPIGCMITIDTADVRAAFNVNPTQGASGLGFPLFVGQTLLLSNPSAVRTLRLISYTNGVASYAQITPLFEYSVNVV
jgi:hypothetical protein